MWGGITLEQENHCTNTKIPPAVGLNSQPVVLRFCFLHPNLTKYPIKTPLSLEHTNTRNLPNVAMRNHKTGIKFSLPFQKKTKSDGKCKAQASLNVSPRTLKNEKKRKKKKQSKWPRTPGPVDHYAISSCWHHHHLDCYSPIFGMMTEESHFAGRLLHPFSIDFFFSRAHDLTLYCFVWSSLSWFGYKVTRSNGDEEN